MFLLLFFVVVVLLLLLLVGWFFGCCFFLGGGGGGGGGFLQIVDVTIRGYFVVLFNFAAFEVIFSVHSRHFLLLKLSRSVVPFCTF